MIQRRPLSDVEQRIVHAEKFDTILQRDWRIILTVLFATLALVIGVSLMRLDNGGRQTLHEWQVEDQKLMEATR